MVIALAFDASSINYRREFHVHKLLAGLVGLRPGQPTDEPIGTLLLRQGTKRRSLPTWIVPNPEVA